MGCEFSLEVGGGLETRETAMVAEPRGWAHASLTMARLWGTHGSAGSGHWQTHGSRGHTTHQSQAANWETSQHAQITVNAAA